MMTRNTNDDPGKRNASQYTETNDESGLVDQHAST